jgi:hypothetical protein
LLIGHAEEQPGHQTTAGAGWLGYEGRDLPAPRSLSALRDDPEVAPDLREHIVALVAVPTETIRAAE